MIFLVLLRKNKGVPLLCRTPPTRPGVLPCALLLLIYLIHFLLLFYLTSFVFYLFYLCSTVSYFVCLLSVLLMHYRTLCLFGTGLLGARVSRISPISCFAPVV